MAPSFGNCKTRRFNEIDDMDVDHDDNAVDNVIVMLSLQIMISILWMKSVTYYLMMKASLVEIPWLEDLLKRQVLA
jgi:hypothetical protein